MALNDKLLVVGACLTWMTVLLYLVTDLKNKVCEIRIQVAETRNYLREK